MDKPWVITAKILKYISERKNFPNCYVDADELLEDKKLNLSVNNKYKIVAHLAEMQKDGLLRSGGKLLDKGEIYQMNPEEYNRFVGDADLSRPSDYKRVVKKLRRDYKRKQRTDKLEIWVLWGNAVVWIPGLVVTLIAIVEFFLLFKKCE